jgi:phosphatidylserine decarboxylase
MINIFPLFILILFVCTCLYYYLHKKTRISLSYLYKDNIFIILISSAFSLFLFQYSGLSFFSVFVLGIISVPAFSFFLIMGRFYRNPTRKSDASENEILSPADGNVIYIKKCSPLEIPENVKKERTALLSEFSGSDLLKNEYWHIGINMTPFDVHRNSAPMDGKIEMVEHFEGEFLSLKKKDAKDKNERCSYLISNDFFSIGIVQIASRLVRRIESYVEVGDHINRGEWIGMINFGSQVDMIIPGFHVINITVGQQLYAGKSVIATRKPSERSGLQKPVKQKRIKQ